MKIKNKAAVILGKRGGISTKTKGKAYFARIGKKGAKARWKREAKLKENIERQIDAIIIN